MEESMDFCIVVVCVSILSARAAPSTTGTPSMRQVRQVIHRVAVGTAYRLRFDSEIRVTAPPGERRKEGAKHIKT